MKRKMLLILLLLCVLITSACSNQKDEETPQFLDVMLDISPEKIEKGTLVTFNAKVTYGEEEVTDADEVTFEIWRANDENHEKTTVEHKKDGNYTLEKSFDQEGTYYVYAHVTARSMHNMPKKEFIVGKASEPEKEDSSSTMDMEEDESMDHSDH